MKPKKMPVKEAKDSEVKKLKNRLRRQDKEIAKLKSDLKTYDRYFQETQSFVVDKTKDFSVEELINASKNKKNIKEMSGEKNFGSTCLSCFSKNVQVDELSFGTITICRDCSHTKVDRHG